MWNRKQKRGSNCSRFTVLVMFTRHQRVLQRLQYAGTKKIFSELNVSRIPCVRKKKIRGSSSMLQHRTTNLLLPHAPVIHWREENHRCVRRSWCVPVGGRGGRSGDEEKERGKLEVWKWTYFFSGFEIRPKDFSSRDGESSFFFWNSFGILNPYFETKTK